MSVTRNKLIKKFTVIPNAIITDLNVTETALRVYLYLLSKPDGWKVLNADIQKQLDIKTNERMANIWKSLIDSGWISREKILNKQNQFAGGYDYVLNEFSVNATLGETHNMDNPKLGEIPNLGKPEGHIIKTDISLNTELLNNTKVKKGEFDFEGFNENEIIAIKDWLAYKKEKQQPYTSLGLKSLKTRLLGFKDLIVTINNSISNNYSGLFDDKTFIKTKQVPLIHNCNSQDYSNHGGF